MDDLDVFLRRASAASVRFRVPKDMTGLAAGSLTQMPDRRRAESGFRALIEAVLHIADSHQPCASARPATRSATGSPWRWV